MKITFETHERTGEWYCILWNCDMKITHTMAPTANEAERLMKEKLLALFKR